MLFERLFSKAGSKLQADDVQYYINEGNYFGAPTTFALARLHCQSFDAELASPETQEDEELLLKALADIPVQSVMVPNYLYGIMYDSKLQQFFSVSSGNLLPYTPALPPTVLQNLKFTTSGARFQCMTIQVLNKTPTIGIFPCSMQPPVSNFVCEL
jgi:hypothetical protein